MSSTWKNKRETGYRHQLRFDLTDDQIRRELKDYGLYHSLTDGTDVATVLDTILDHNGAMISTVEKVRIGVPVGGMSPGADMESGGASYFFTRIRKLPGKGGGHERSGFYLKPELLRRMDSITHENDKYGRVTGNHVRHFAGPPFRTSSKSKRDEARTKRFSKTRSRFWTISKSYR